MANAAAYRHAGARAEHRRRLRRPARPRLCRVLRHRRLYLRHPDRVPGAAGVERVLGAVPLARPGRADAGETGAADVVHFTLSFWLALPLLRRSSRRSSASLFGAPTLRLRGDYLAIVTLGFGEIVPIVVRNWSDLTNGAAGLNGVAAPQPVRLELRRRCDAVLLCRRSPWWRCWSSSASGCANSRIGRAWMAIREDEIAAGAMGVNRTQVQAAGLRHRRRVRRHDRRVLRRQAADRDAGDVRLPGLGDDPGDDRVRRHRQRLGRGARRRSSCSCCSPGGCRT